ncbi:MAG: domain S-box, partial [Neobacillus sp.]|nr:domain S-box [Neobacillus sp.]
MKESLKTLLGPTHESMLDELLYVTQLDKHELVKKMIEESHSRIQEDSETQKGKVPGTGQDLIIDGFALGDELSDGILVSDNKGIILRVNKAYSKITGINEEEIMGQHLQTFIDKKYFSMPVSLLVLKEKRKISAMSTIAANKKKVLLTGTPIFDNNGEVIQVYTIMRDLTEMIQLKEQLEEKQRENERYYKALKHY